MFVKKEELLVSDKYNIELVIEIINYEKIKENYLETWVETIKKHYTTMRGFHPETYKITLGDIEATARFFYDLGLKKAMEEKPIEAPEGMYN